MKIDPNILGNQDRHSALLHNLSKDPSPEDYSFVSALRRSAALDHGMRYSTDVLMLLASLLSD